MEKETLLNGLQDVGQREGLAAGLLLRAIGEQIRALRKARRLSQDALAALAGMEQPTISDLEAAKNANPETSTLLRLARALQVRLRISLETFGSLLTYTWAPPSPLDADPLLQVPRADASAEQLRLNLADAEYRHEYAETAAFSDLASQILTLRRQRGLAQDGLSARSGVIQKTLSRLENPLDESDLPNFTLTTLKSVSYALDVRLQVEFVSFGTLLDALGGFTTESLRRPEPTFDPVLFPLPTSFPPAPDPSAPERTRWMQALLIPWLHQDDRLATGNLLRWLQGQDLPPVGHDEEPYQWILRGLPPGQPRYARKLAERLAVVLSEQPDVSPVVRGQDDDFLSNLYWTCAGLQYPGALGEPLWEAYKRLEHTKLSSPVRDALQGAIVHNQFGDKPFNEIWKPMVESGRHRWLPGNEVVAYEGLLVRSERHPDSAILFALELIANRWSGAPQEVSALRRLLSRIRPTWQEYLHLRKSAQLWPAWTQAAFPVRIKEEAERVMISTQLSEGSLEAEWRIGEPGSFRWRGERIDGNDYPLPNKKSFLNAYVTILGDFAAEVGVFTVRSVQPELGYRWAFAEMLAA